MAAVITIRLYRFCRSGKECRLPTDARLHKKIVKKVPGMVKEPGFPLRQGYTFVLKGICRDRRFRNHPKDRKEALGADRRLRTMAGRPVRESKRNLKGNHDHDRLLELLGTILSQRRDSRKKVHSIHEPEVQCVSKGKEHKKYESGNKVSIVRSATGIILGAMSFRNEHDGHDIGPSLEQVERLTGRKIKVPAGDRGYGGKKETNGTRIVIPDIPEKSDSRHQGLKKHKLFRKRAGIEASTGHLKSDYRLARNFYKSVAGEAVNVLPAAAAYNFKGAMKALWYLLQNICEILLRDNIPQNWTF